jgi:hypothetical protein
VGDGNLAGGQKTRWRGGQGPAARELEGRPAAGGQRRARFAGAGRPGTKEDESGVRSGQYL